MVPARDQHPTWQFHDRRPAMVDQWRDCHDRWSRFILVRKAQIRMTEIFHIGDHVKVYLDSKFGINEGWYEGSLVRIDPYSEHRSFYWVELNMDVQLILGIKQISVFNLKNIKNLEIKS